MIIWEFAVSVGAVMCGWYYWRQSGHMPFIRRAIMICSLTCGTILLAGPIARNALVDFQWHMVQHIGLMMLIAPGLVLGAPVAVLERRHAAGVARMLGNPVVRFLLHPKVGWVVFVGTLFATHFTVVASFANTSVVAHQLVLCWFLVAGVTYYYPVLSGNPQSTTTPHAVRIISLLTMMVPETMTGFFLYTSSHTLHDVPVGVDVATALHQQQAGGALMWAAAMAIDTCWIALAVRDWLADEELRVDD